MRDNNAKDTQVSINISRRTFEDSFLNQESLMDDEQQQTSIHMSTEENFTSQKGETRDSRGLLARKKSNRSKVLPFEVAAKKDLKISILDPGIDYIDTASLGKVISPNERRQKVFTRPTPTLADDFYMPTLPASQKGLAKLDPLNLARVVAQRGTGKTSKFDPKEVEALFLMPQDSFETELIKETKRLGKAKRRLETFAKT